MRDNPRPTLLTGRRPPQTYLITGADPPDSRLTHGDLSQPASDTLPLCPHGVAGLRPQPPPDGVALVHRPADTAGSHAEGEERSVGVCLTGGQPDVLHAAVNLGPVLALWLRGGDSNPYEHLLSAVQTPNNLLSLDQET